MTTAVRKPFKTADLRDLERALAAIDRIAARHGDEYDDYEFDAINQVAAAARIAIEEIEGV